MLLKDKEKENYFKNMMNYFYESFDPTFKDKKLFIYDCLVKFPQN